MPRLIRIQLKWHISKKLDDPRWLELRICKLVEMKSLALLLRRFAQWLMKQVKRPNAYFDRDMGARKYPDSQYNPVVYYQGYPHELISPSRRLEIILKVNFDIVPNQRSNYAEVYIDGKNVTARIFGKQNLMLADVEKLMLEDAKGSFFSYLPPTISY